MRRALVVEVASALAVLLACGPAQGPSGSTSRSAVAMRARPSSDSRSLRADAFRAALEADGFDVEQGFATIADPLDAVDAHVMDSAAGFNYPQYYKRFVVPALGGGLDANEVGFRLAEDEAIVYLGPTPPRGDYFSFCPMLWARSPDVSGAYLVDWIFASVRDPLNNLGIHTAGRGEPFHKNTMIVFTADEGIYERIASSARSAGVPSAILNAYPLPRSDLKMGNAPSDDLLAIFVRTANFTSAAEGSNYIHDDAWAAVYRVTPKIAAPLQPFQRPAWRDRTFTHEAELLPELPAALERLEAAILARTDAAASPEPRHLESVRWFRDSRAVLEAEDDPSSADYHAFVAGESTDTPYFRSAEDGTPTNFTLGNDDMVVVYGVNHAAVGVATYSNMTVYGDWMLYPCPAPGSEPQYLYGCGEQIWNGVVSMNSHAFTGSAEEYIPGDSMAPYLYAVRVVRAARAGGRDRYRVVVPEPTPSPYYQGELSANGIPLHRPAMIGYRAYLNPVTGSGPRHEDLIPDRAIWFRLQ